MTAPLAHLTLTVLAEIAQESETHATELPPTPSLEVALELEISRLEAVLDAMAHSGQPLTADGYQVERVAHLRQMVVARSEKTSAARRRLDERCQWIADLDRRNREISAALRAAETEVDQACRELSDDRVADLARQETALLSEIERQRLENETWREEEVSRLRDECDALISELPGLEHPAALVGDAVGRTASLLPGLPIGGDELPPRILLQQLEAKSGEQQAERRIIERFGKPELSRLAAEQAAQRSLAAWLEGEVEGQQRWSAAIDKLARPFAERSRRLQLEFEQQAVPLIAPGELTGEEYLGDWLDGEIVAMHATTLALTQWTDSVIDLVAEHTWALSLLSDAELATLAQSQEVPTLDNSLAWALRHGWSGRMDVLRQGEKVGDVMVCQGRIAWASAKAQRRHLGTFLRSLGQVTNEQMNMVRAIFSQTGGRKSLGSILEEQGFIEPGVLRRCMTLHIRIALEQLLAEAESHTILSPGEVGRDDEMLFYPEEVLPMHFTMELM